MLYRTKYIVDKVLLKLSIPKGSLLSDFSSGQFIMKWTFNSKRAVIKKIVLVHSITFVSLGMKKVKVKIIAKIKKFGKLTKEILKITNNEIKIMSVK